MSHQYLETSPMDISDDDILKAMKDISGYLDITTGDFKKIYRLAYRHAVDRLIHSVTAREVMTTDVVFVKRDDPLEGAAHMHATKTFHPPGGATSLIAVIGSQKIHNLGYLYAVIPAGLGAAVMLFVALLVNNIPKNRRYPEYWF